MTETEVANLALSNIGSTKRIGALDTERSQEANSCRTFYSISREMTLRDFEWEEATKFQALALVEENPNNEWRYAYRYPDDCLYFRRISVGTRGVSKDSRPKFRLGSDDAGRLIYTDEPNAIGVYTKNPTHDMTADFYMTQAHRLAAYIAPGLTGGDPTGIANRELQLYQLEGGKAKMNSANEAERDEDDDGELLGSR